MQARLISTDGGTDRQTDIGIEIYANQEYIHSEGSKNCDYLPYSWENIFKIIYCKTKKNLKKLFGFSMKIFGKIALKNSK